MKYLGKSGTVCKTNTSEAYNAGHQAFKDGKRDSEYPRSFNYDLITHWLLGYQAARQAANPRANDKPKPFRG